MMLMQNTSSNHAVEFKTVSRVFGTMRAVDRVSITIAHGEFFTLLGSSGSGKTTSLRLIAGFEMPDEGNVFIDGQDVSRVQAYRRNVHTVFQDYALFPHLTVQENILFALNLKGVADAESKRRVEEVLELVQLSGLGTRKPSQLSGGQQQRVALARAVVDRPAVLLLDEPLSALDAKIRSELREQLKQLQRETGITFVYVTHDQEEALTLSDRLAVMRQGRILQIGKPTDIYDHPADLFVAQFIGKANFIPAKVIRVENDTVLATAHGVQVEARAAEPLTSGCDVQLMIRPEQMRIVESGRGVFTATIIQAQFQGFATEYLARTKDATYRVLELRRHGTAPRAEGEAVHLGWTKDDALAFRTA